MLQLASATMGSLSAGRLLSHVGFFNHAHNMCVGHAVRFVHESCRDNLSAEGTLHEDNFSIGKTADTTSIGCGVMQFEFKGCSGCTGFFEQC